ncbi:hypothetical protein D9M68_710030 [compost metagenome]
MRRLAINQVQGLLVAIIIRSPAQCFAIYRCLYTVVDARFIKATTNPHIISIIVQIGQQPYSVDDQYTTFRKAFRLIIQAALRAEKILYLSDMHLINLMRRNQ